MAASFKSLFKTSKSSKVDDGFRYTPARSSSDEGEGSLSSDGLLEKDAIVLPQKRSLLRRYMPLIIIHAFIFVLYIFLLYLVASFYAGSERLNGSGLVFCMCIHICE